MFTFSRNFMFLIVILFNMFISAEVFSADIQDGVDVSFSVAAVEISDVGENSHRLPYHVDSLISAAIVMIAVLIAWLLNHTLPRYRVFGVALSAVSAVGVAVAIFYLNFSGALDSVHSHKLFTDDLKPSIMRVLGIIFFILGAFLLGLAHRQSKRQDALKLDRVNTVDRYGGGTRMLHWVTAILIIFLMPMGIYTTMIPEEAWYRQGYYVAHKTLGFVVLFLVLARIIWHRKSPVPALNKTLKTWGKKLAHSAHLLLYLIMFAFPVTGYVMSTLAGKLSHLFIWDFPLIFPPDAELVVYWGALHKLILPVLLTIILVAHVFGAVKHRFIDKHKDAFTRMVG